MRQVLRKGFRDIVVEEVPDPVAGPHQVLVQPEYSLISSGTETASIHQESIVKEAAANPSQIEKIWEVMKVMGPVRTLSEVHAKFSEYAVLGYSGAGVVVEKHPTVTGLEVGSRVAYGGEGTGHAETIVTGRKLVARIPDAVRCDQACFTTLGSIALNAVRVAAPGLGERVVVIGLGLVGQLISQLLRLQGAVVIATDLRDSRVELSRRLGADYALQGGDGLTSRVAALTDGRGADCVIVAAASKSPAVCRQALSVCRDRGRIVVVGAVELSFPWNEMYLKEIQLLMARAYGPGSYDALYEKQGQDYPLPYVRWTENRNMQEFLRLLETGKVQVDPLVTHRFELEQAPAAYEAILAPGSASLAVLLRYPREPEKTAGEFRARRRVEVAEAAPGKDLQVGLVGAAGIARWAHVPGLNKIPHVNLRAVYSSSGARGKSYAERFHASYCCSSYDEMLRDEQIGLVLIVTRNQYHARQAAQALEAGKHVFVEKPMAITEEECRLLCAAAESSGRQLTVGFNRRFAPFYRQQKHALKGRTGPAVINCRVNSPGISGSFWMADPAIGGAILGEACHFVDLMYWLLESEPVEVFAFSLPRGGKDPIGENNLAASFRFADGSIATLTYCTVGSKHSGGERVEIFAPGVGAFCEDFKSLGINSGRRTRRSAWWADKGYEEQLSSFVAAIREGKPPETTLRDGVRATVGCLRMLDSCRGGKPCPIDIEAVLG